jgi:hypothetical protein
MVDILIGIVMVKTFSNNLSKRYGGSIINILIGIRAYVMPLI